MENENVIDNIEYSGNKEEKKEKSTASKFTTNVLIFILSLILAVFVWVYVMSVDAPNSEQTFYGVNVSVNNLDRLNETMGLSVVSEDSGIQIDVVLQGKRSVLSKLTAEDIKAYVDVGALTEAGTHSLDIKYMPFPGGTTFVRASSGTVSMVVDSTIEEQIPVKVKFENCILPDGYSMGESIINTEFVKVTGAKSDIEKIESAVITVSTGTLTGSVTVMDKIPVLCDKSGKEISSRYINYEKTYVDVYVPVYLEKELQVKVDFVHGLYNDKNTTVTVSPAKIKVKGEAAKVEKLGDSITVGSINEKTTGNVFTFDIVQSMLGEGVELLNGSKRVIATVAHNGVETTEFLMEAEDFTVNNPHKIGYTLAQDGIVIKLRCPTGKLGDVNSENVQVVLDLSNLGGQGDTFTANLKIIFKGELEGLAYELSTYTVDVTIIRD